MNGESDTSGMISGMKRVVMDDENEENGKDDSFGNESNKKRKVLVDEKRLDG
eukprot:CAMPEP_0182449972 /NCGR_PEP_ID=MMETSP1172-20130603/38021_1 /TAXON_ID=708627 /ORGANISM="Timspurckia oligopyrenoides, Strain CCMP3278" /LENGTH=51 /DNA_ID=CAMNT_0024647413 /DNA_START=39 /DNA_END=190 /DNA_ORIENTATION=+